MGRFFSRLIFINILGWKLEGFFPSFPKYIVAVVPHTSWIDFFIGILVRSVSGESIKFVGKKELFNPFTGWFFRSLGGTPIDRSGNKGSVESIVAAFEDHEKFRIALAPEGTRKRVKKLRSGFYQIAKKLQIPIVPVSFDYGNKKVLVHGSFYTSKDEKNDIIKLETLLKGVEGYSVQKSF